jgi:hypothetical protein
MHNCNFVWVPNLVSDFKWGGYRPRIFENMMLRRIFWPIREEMVGGWKKLHNEKINNLCPLPGIIRMIKSRRMRGEVHV